MTLRVAIVGGGITGLTAAYALEARARAEDLPIDVTLLEASGKLGGKISTEQVGNVLVEQGPDALFIRRAETVEFCDRLGLEEQAVRGNTQHRQTYVLRAGQLHPLPAGMEGGVPRSVWPLAGSALLSPLGKVRAAFEAVLPPSTQEVDESVGTFIRRRFGREVAQRVAAPLLGSIYSGDIDELSLATLLPQLRDAERTHGSVLRHAWSGSGQPRTSPGQGRPASPFLTLRSGLAGLPRAVRLHLFRTSVHLHAHVRDLQRHGDSYRLELGDDEWVDADRVILTTPSHAAASLLQDAAPHAAGLLRDIQYTSVIVVALLLPARAEASLPPGSGFVVAPDSRQLLTACSFTSRKWPHTAPDGSLVLRAHVHLDQEPGLLDVPDSALIGAVRAELGDVLGLTADPWATRVYRWPAAIPMYKVGHLDRLAAIQAALESVPGIHLAGAAYRGAGIPECIAQGLASADAVLREARPSLVAA